MSAASLASSSPEPARAAAIIVAGGGGQRMGGGVRKQFRKLAGEPVLLWAIRPFLRHAGIGTVVVVLPPGEVDQPPPWLCDLPVTLVAGGAERGDSVWNGLGAVPDDADPVLIHDGARPLVSADVISRVLAGAASGGAVAGIPVTDTIKETDEQGRIRGTPDRARLWQAQTPQGFPREVILGAYRRARAEGVAATDDAALCERFGWPVAMVQGSPENIKITRPADMAIAEVLARTGALV